MKKTGPVFRVLKVLSAVLTIALLYSCNREEQIEPEPDPPVTDSFQITERGAQIDEDGVKIDMPQTSVFVKGDINDHLIEYNKTTGQLVFETCATVDQAAIQQGDVLFSGIIPEIAPDGYLVKVLKIERTNSRTVLDTEPAGLNDAFNDLSIEYSLSSITPSEKNVIVWDPFLQDDLTPDEGDPMTRAINGDIDFDLTKDNFFKLDIEKYKLTVGKEYSSLEIIIFDADEDYETKNDQARLVFKVDYEFQDGKLELNKEGVIGFTEVGLVMDLGGSAGFHYKPKTSLGLQDVPFIDKQFNQFQDSVEKKLMKKKIRVATWDFPLEDIPKIGPVLAAIFNLRLDLYFKLDFDIKGDIGVDLIIEPYHIDARWENQPYQITKTNPNTSWLKVTKDGGCHTELMADASVKGTVGVGAGIVVGFKKMVDLLVSEKGEKPYAGYFLELGNVMDFKFHSSWDTRTNKLMGSLTGKDYFMTEGYQEIDVRFKNGLMWKGKQDYPSLTYKIPDIPLEKTWDFELNYPVPVPYPVSPEYQAIIQDQKTVTLKWEVSHLAFTSSKTYALYCSTDRALVEQCSPRALIASGLKEMQYDVDVDPMETYYWKVVTTTSSGWEYPGSVYYFDTGYDGIFMLNEPLSNFLKDNWTVLDGVRIEADGKVFRTPSNKKALSEIRELVIQDPKSRYGIYTLDDLLANLPSLETLNCNYNDIRTFDFSHNPNLKRLACRNNSLMGIDLSTAPKLQALNCGKNKKITGLDLTQCPDIKILTCDDCNISELDLSLCHKIQDIYASENHLSVLDISRCPYLIRLDVYSQSVDRLLLRLTQAQMDGALDLRPHVNMDYEIVSISGIETSEAFDITNHSAAIKVSALDREPYTAVGILYSHWEHTPDIHTELTEQIVVQDQLYASFTLDELLPDTDYYARGFALNAGNMQYWYGNTVHFKTLPRDPAPEVSIEPDIIRFGEVNPFKRVSQDVTLTNIGELDLTYEILCPDGTPFTVTPTSRKTLKPSESQLLSVSFTPTEAGDFSAMFTVRSNDPRGDQFFEARGTGAGDPLPDYSHLELEAGRYFQLPQSDERLVWKTSDDSIVAVDEFGGVYAISTGTAVVRGFSQLGDTVIRSDITVTGVLPEYVDIGLPVKWATCNLGASTPYDTGYLYAWGEAEPKESFSWDNYQWGRNKALTKYCFNAENGKDGFTDNKWEFDLEDDAAYRMKGGNWRVPASTYGIGDLPGARVTVNNIQGVMVRGKDSGFSDRWLFFQSDVKYWMNFLPGWAMSLAGACLHTKWDSVGLYGGTSYSDVQDRSMGSPVRPVLLIPVTGVSLNKTSLTMERGSVAELKATVYPSDATDKSLTWSVSGDKNAVTLSHWDTDAQIRAEKPGFATVIITSNDGGFTAECKVSVVIYIKSLEMEEIPKLVVGESRDIMVTWSPHDATETELVWSSDDPTIASVSNGTVKGLKAGKTRIRAIVKAEAKGHIEAIREVEVINRDGSHEGFTGETW